MFEDPRPLRRSRRFIGALSDLEFGYYKALDGSRVPHDRTIWLGMITSDAPGDGGRLLDNLTKGCLHYGLALVGEPSALRPRDWAKERPFSHDPKTLLCWYIKHDFRVVQNGTQTRVVYSPKGAMLTASFSLT